MRDTKTFPQPVEIQQRLSSFIVFIVFVAVVSVGVPGPGAGPEFAG